MRLQEVYSICKTANDSWVSPEYDERKEAGNVSYYLLKNFGKIKTLIDSLESIPSLSDSVFKIRNTSIAFTQRGDTKCYFDVRGKNAFSAEYRTLSIKVEAITELFEKSDYPLNNNGFDIKLPPEISLSDLAKCAKDLNTIFSVCPLFSSSDGVISFSSVDVGSSWLTFVITGTAIMVILERLAKLVDKAIIVRSHYLSTKEQEERMRSLKIGNDILEEYKRVYEKVGEAIIKKESDELAKENNINDPEDQLRLTESVKLLAEWMEKGMEVYASIHAAPEVKAVFAPVNEQALPENIVTLLKSGDEPEE